MRLGGLKYVNHANKMDIITRIAIGLMLVGVSFCGVYGQSNKTPEGRVQNFYNWYLKAINDEQDPAKNRTVMNSHLSVRLSKWFYSKAGQDLDGDYFVGSQEWSDQWAGNVNVGELTIKRTTAIVNITLGPMSDEWYPKLRIDLIKEGAVWKIDRVKATQ